MYLCPVKNRKFIGFLLSASVLFAILFQSFHSAEHLVAQFTEDHCHHHHKDGNAEFTHQHHGHEHCFVCEYSFSNFLYTDINSIAYLQFYSVDSRDISQLEIYTSSIFNLRQVRGPPAIIA